MDTSKLPEARIERERYVLAWFEHSRRVYYSTSSWTTSVKKAEKYSTQQEALRAIEAYGQKYHRNGFTRPWEIWLVAESKPVKSDWRVDSVQQVV